MPRQRTWVIGDIEVHRSDVRRWMEVFGRRCPDSMYWDYVRQYRVPEKIAALQAARKFERVIKMEAARLGVTVRKARAPSKAKGLAYWKRRHAANDQDYRGQDATEATMLDLG